MVDIDSLNLFVSISETFPFTGLWSDPSPQDHRTPDQRSREERARTHENLLSSYARRLSQTVPGWSGSPHRGLRNPSQIPNIRPTSHLAVPAPVGLIDPQSDPLLSLASDQILNDDHLQGISLNPNSFFSGAQSESQVGSAFATRFLGPPVRALSSPPPVQTFHDAGDVSIAGEVEIPLDSVISQPPSTWMIRNRPQVPSASSASQTTGLDNSRSTRNSLLQQRNVGTEDAAFPERSVPGSRTTRPSVDSGSATVSLNSVPVTGLFSNFLGSQASSSTCTSTSGLRPPAKPFQSIRERLQSNTPLTTVNVGVTMTTTSGVQAQATGIPKVTIILGSSTQSHSTVSSVEKCSKKTNKKSGNILEPTAGAIPKVTIISSDGQRNMSDLYSSANLIRDPNTVNATQSTCIVSHTVTSNNSAVETPGCSATVVGELMPRSARPSCDNSVDSVLDSRQTPATAVSYPEVAVSVPSTSTGVSSNNVCNLISQGPESIVASTSSHSTLFENIFHRSNTLAECALTASNQVPSQQQFNTMLPSQLQNWQNRTRYMSIMGPYLESRGINPVSTVTHPSALDIQPQEVPIVTLQSASEFPPSASLQHSRDQASSDTENELSSHLSTSGAYFLPITEDQRRSLSSTSLNRNTDPALLRQFSQSAESSDSVQGQSSRSSSQGQDIELVVDQNENYTTNRMGGQGDTQNISVRNHDSNNNSIHILTSQDSRTSTVSSNIEDRNQDYLRLRDSFVSMTDQIEREMNELNRRISALRESFNQSIRSLRQDRRHYESFDGLIQSETASNIGGTDNGYLNVSGELNRLGKLNSSHRLCNVQR